MRRSTRIDQLSTNKSEQRLYQPLRKSLLKPNRLSLSNISNSNLNLYNYNSIIHQTNNEMDLQTSRLSSKIRSLSPQQIQSIKSNIYVPINKKLIPTKNYSKIKNKRFSAINVQEKVFKPIPEHQFKQFQHSNTFNHVQEVVYEVQDEEPVFNSTAYSVSPPLSVYQSQQLIKGSSPNFFQRTSNFMSPVSPKAGSTKFITVSPSKNIYTARENYQIKAPQGHAQSFIRTSSPQINIVNAGQNKIIHNNNNNPQVFYQKPISPRPIITPQPQIMFPHKNISFINPASIRPSQPIIIYNRPQVTTKPLYVNQGPSERILSQTSLLSPIPSQTSFQIQKMQKTQKPNKLQIKGYDFQRSNQSTSITQQSTRRQKQDFKYNLFSILDEPSNTKCQQTNCMNNQIIASMPKNAYEWRV